MFLYRRTDVVPGERSAPSHIKQMAFHEVPFALQMETSAKFTIAQYERAATFRRHEREHQVIGKGAAPSRHGREQMR
ncbi:hypothetical protein JCM14722_22040 [Pseudodesulfovibrio portus]|uniref:Uncharacterized protein n=1 Tax=Pseudodesulfovibrio portus TaxID=231439 RepID=A0ABM8ATG5_9BACT|nr:hypothetical protein JCM14722_22040 [Pseudodesulfovibrio portus]